MQSLTQIPELMAAAVALCVAALLATGLAGGKDAPEESQAWGDDPTVMAMLSGMSL